MAGHPGTMKRRRFVTLAALSAAALVTAPLERAAAAPPRHAGKAAAKPPGAVRRPATAAMRREIANQELSLAKQLAAIRAFELPPGSPMAFAFKALRARGRR